MIRLKIDIAKERERVSRQTIFGTHALKLDRGAFSKKLVLLVDDKTKRVF
jgi:hypothetical protein